MKRTPLYISLAALCSSSVFSVSIVYNMRIAEITKRQNFSFSAKRHNIFSDALIGQWRELKNGFKQSLYASLASYIRNGKSWYLKVDGAVGRVNNNVLTQTFSRTQTDDLLISGGYSLATGKKGRSTCSMLFGIPTHRDFTLDLAQLGTGHIGIGGQLDYSYVYKAMPNNLVLFAARCIHFMPRSATSKNPCVSPLYQCNEYKLYPGELIDVYFAHQTNWAKKNRIEVGYDCSFIGLHAKADPEILNFAGSVMYMRHSFFGAYFRLIPIKKVPTALIIGTAGGFDSRPCLIGNRFMITSWLIYGVLF